MRPLRSTGDAARLLAARMGYALAQAIQSIRCAGGLGYKSQLEGAVRSVVFPVSTGYEINVPGLLTIKADGPAGHARVMERWRSCRRSSPVCRVRAPGLRRALHGRFHRDRPSTSRPSASSPTTPRPAAPHPRSWSPNTAWRCSVTSSTTSPWRTWRPTHIDAFREALASWPARARVLPAYRGLSAKAIVAKAKKRGEGGLSIRTMEKHLDRLRTFFNWSVQRRELAHNPLTGLRLQTNADKYTKTKRGFRPEELGALFDPVRRAEQCDNDPMYFWIPLFGLFTGARLSEAAQLLVSDLAEIGGVWGIHITGEGAKSVKNAQSKRFVPVPERLLALGLLDYSAEVKALGFSALFPGGSVGAKNGPGIGSASSSTEHCFAAPAESVTKLCRITRPATPSSRRATSWDSRKPRSGY